MITKGVRVETDSDGTDSYLAASPDNQSDDDNDDVGDIKQKSLHLTVKNTGQSSSFSEKYSYPSIINHFRIFCCFFSNF